MDNKFEIIKYRDGDFELDVNLSPTEETVWLSIKQMSELFDVSVDNIQLHIKNIINDGELDGVIYEDSSAMVQNGRIYKFKIYNLEMISSVGYRIKNIYTEKEQNEFTSSAKNAVQINGQIHYIKIFNLDVIMSVGYRVKSPRGNLFRIWANSILKQ